MNKHIKRGLVLACVLAVSAGSAMAAVDPGVTSAITGAGTDGSTIVSALAAAGAGVYLGAKVLRKFGVML